MSQVVHPVTFFNTTSPGANPVVLWNDDVANPPLGADTPADDPDAAGDESAPRTEVVEVHGVKVDVTDPAAPVIAQPDAVVTMTVPNVTIPDLPRA